jgi:preprotein translocase subunit SecG
MHFICSNPSNATAFQDAQTSYETALLAESVQRMCEVAVLVFIASAFVVGFSLMYRTSDALAPKRERKFELSIMRLSMWGDQGLSPQDDASSGGDAGSARSTTQFMSARSTTQFMKRIYSLGFIFCMFLLRAVWSCLVIRGDLGRFNASCAPCDGSCQDQGTLVNTYLFFSPEFAFSVIVLSEPISYLVAICKPPLPPLPPSLPFPSAIARDCRHSAFERSVRCVSAYPPPSPPAADSISGFDAADLHARGEQTDL